MIKKIPLLDTNAFESFRKSNKDDRVLNALKISKFYNTPIILTDLSFVELIEGRKFLSEFDNLRNFINTNNIDVSGHSFKLFKIGKKALQHGFSNEKDYAKFRKNLIVEKINYLKDFYFDMSIKFSALLITILYVLDEKYFSPIFRIFTNLVFEKSNELKKLTNSIIEKHFKNQFETNNLLLDFAVCIFESICEKYKPAYIKNEFETKINSMGIPAKMSSLTAKAIVKLKQRKEFKYLNQYESTEISLMVLVKNIYKINGFENKILCDGLTYSVIHSGFCLGKFQKNDLVDIYNISYAANEESFFVYYTLENKWNRFAEIEETIEPGILKHISLYGH